MKFGASSYLWVSPFSNRTLDQLSHAKSFGFDIYEIAAEDPDAFSADDVRRTADSVGIAVHLCGAFGIQRDISSENPAFREIGMKYIRDLIDVAATIGSPYVAGPMYAATGRARLVDAQERTMQRNWVVENLAQLCDYAEKKQILLALEPLNRYETDFMNTVEQGVNLIEEIGRKNLGLLLDTYHMNIEEKSIPDAIRRAGKYIFDFHACANDRGTPGKDHLDWTGIRQALHEVGYSGSIVIESFTPQVTEIARAVSLWRPWASSQDALAKEGLAFLRRTLS